MMRTKRQEREEMGRAYLQYLNDHFEPRNRMWVPPELREMPLPVCYERWQPLAAKHAETFIRNIKRHIDKGDAMNRPDHVRCSNCCRFKPLKETKKRGWCMTDGRRYDRKLYAHDDFCPQWLEDWPEPNKGDSAHA